jgi:hypothetical protein
MGNSNSILPENIHLTQIIWVKENTFLLAEQLTQNPTYTFSMAHNMMHNLEKEVVKIRLFVDMQGYIDTTEIRQGGSYEMDFIFKIDAMTNQYQIIDEKPVFNGLFVSTLLGISYSTLRGILFNIWKETVLNGVILPVISVHDLLKSNR